MKNFKSILAFIIIFNILTIQSICFAPKAIENSLNIRAVRPLNVGVLLYSFDDIFLSLIKKNLEDIQRENESQINFTFFDAKSNSAIQLENVDRVIQGNYDFLVLSMFTVKKDVIDDSLIRLKQKNIPVIFLASNIPQTNSFITNNKAFILNTDPIEQGTMQGKLIVDEWNLNKKSMDKNKDDILQYILIKGRTDSIYTTTRSKYSIDAINNSGIKTQELVSVVSDWSRELAKNTISSLFLKYGNKIEAIIANNDAMAIGAIEALQQYGYNKGDKSKTIPVFGIDAIPEAKDLIKKGYMAGSIFQDPQPIAKAIYDVGRNLVADEIPIEGTNLKLNDKEIIVPLVFKPYTISSN
ncbi:galactose ABC transporter substrate-binding protein [Clostridium sp. SHJSY1]|uniref:galactose ABC transporter substrate-binding protein n=1 Tax=Clostridium sp. SHJSY1 TaxID=2942483 RepID=UPI002876066D|nr:galactose ABC transporter substrate-binding protein [Clostridium sp. SHJSY1]MDS0525957.1 galactose ABC transporter substrate-binding protein [Clostridium sp. SHJSY1]